MTPPSQLSAAPTSIVAQDLPLSIETQQSDVTELPAVRGEYSDKRSKRLKERDKKLRKPKPLNDRQREQLDALARNVADSHREFEQWLVATAARGVQVGQLALQAKKIAGHGHFGAWKESLREQYGISDRSIERYMYLAKHRRQLLASLNQANVNQLDDHAPDALLNGMKLQEALDFLKSSAAAPTRKSSTAEQSARRPSTVSLITAPEPTLLRIPPHVVDIAGELFGQLDFLVGHAAPDSPELIYARWMSSPGDALLPNTSWNGRALIHAYGDHLETVIARSIAEFDQETLEAALLLAPAITDNPTLGSLQSYPRAFFRKRLLFADGNGDEVAAAEPYLLIFLGPAEQTADFALAAGGHSDVYVPYNV